MTTSTYVSVYERRVKLVQEVLAAHTELNAKDAQSLAVHVLGALDHTPEHVR